MEMINERGQRTTVSGQTNPEPHVRFEKVEVPTAPKADFIAAMRNAGVSEETIKLASGEKKH